MKHQAIEIPGTRFLAIIARNMSAVDIPVGDAKALAAGIVYEHGCDMPKPMLYLTILPDGTPYIWTPALAVAPVLQRMLG